MSAASCAYARLCQLTAGLRFESFSGCCGRYARMDVLPSGLDGRGPEPGTTNVDVTKPLRLSLAGVAGLDPWHRSVGPHDVTLFGPAADSDRPALASAWMLMTRGALVEAPV